MSGFFGGSSNQGSYTNDGNVQNDSIGNTSHISMSNDSRRVSYANGTPEFSRQGNPGITNSQNMLNQSNIAQQNSNRGSFVPTSSVLQDIPTTNNELDLGEISPFSSHRKSQNHNNNNQQIVQTMPTLKGNYRYFDCTNKENLPPNYHTQIKRHM